MRVNEFSGQACHEVLDYSTLFHCTIGVLKLDQIGKFQNYLENSQTGSIKDNLVNLQGAWKVSRWPEMFRNGLESFQMAWKVS